MSRMRLLTVSGRTPDKAAMAVWGRARRWCRMVARRRSARVRTGQRPTPGAISRGRWPRRLSRLISRCWSCGVIRAAIRAPRCWAGRPVSTGWQSQARSGLGRSNGPVRELLGELQSERIERNLAARLYNRRGLTGRDPEEGGKQERALADRYRAQASTFSDSWPQTAVVLRNLASMYDTDAREEETRAERFRQAQRK
jgi:hypothetical protein